MIVDIGLADHAAMYLNGELVYDDHNPTLQGALDALGVKYTEMRVDTHTPIPETLDELFTRTGTRKEEI